MNQFKAMCSMLLAVMMVFASHPAQASSNPFIATVDYLNYNKSVSSFAGPLKEKFKTQEDHRQIDNMIKSLEKTTTKWIWRFEMPKKDQLALRVNGRIQWKLSDYDFENNSFKINGQKIAFKKGESFLSFHKKITNLLTEKTAFYDQMFFNEAHAIAPLWILGGLFAIGAAAAASSAKAAPRCSALPNTVAGDVSKNKRQNFRNGETCSPRSMPRDYQRRIEMVSKNFKWNEKFSARENPHQYPTEKACETYYKNGRNFSEEHALQICKCIERKQLRCNQGGWNMLPPNPPYVSRNNPKRSYQDSMAAQTCEVALAHHNGQCHSTPTPTTNYQPYQPISGDRPGITPKYNDGGNNPYQPISPETPGTSPKYDPYDPPQTRD